MNHTQLGDVCAEYLRTREFELADATKETCRRACRHLLRWMAECDHPQLDRPAGSKYRNWLVATGRSHGTANMYLRSLQAMLTWAVAEGFVAASPLAGVKQFVVTPKPVTIYEDWQFLRMLHFLPRPTADDPQRDVRWLGLLWGGRTTGLRRGALLNLTWDNIRGGLVYVEPKKATDRTWPWQPKTKKTRKVPLLPQFARVLEDLADRHYPLAPPAIVERLLAGELAGRWRKCPELNFRRTFVGIQRRAFGRQIGDFHQLRRTYTTDLTDVLPDSAVMELCGWTRRQTVSRYAGVRQSHYAVAYDRLAEVGKRGLGGLQPADFGGRQAGFKAPRTA